MLLNNQICACLQRIRPIITPFSPLLRLSEMIITTAQRGKNLKMFITEVGSVDKRQDHS